MSVPLRQRETRRSIVAAILGAYMWLASGVAIGADIDFYRDVYPALKTNCIACHNKTTTKAALNMETPESIRKGGDSGEGVVPGNSGESLVYQAAAHVGNIQMPPKGNKSGASKLTTNELALLKGWIDQGAKSSIKQTQQVVWQTLPAGVHPIYSTAITRDGLLAACGRANQVYVYDVTTRQLIARLADESLNKPGSSQASGPAHRALVQSLAFSPDGLRLASGSFREVKIWKRENPLVATRKRDPTISSIASVISDDAKLIVCADKDGVIHLLDAATGKVLRTIPTEIKGGITLLGVSPDGSKLGAYGADGTLTLWNLTDGQRIASKAGLAGVRSLAWTRDGKAIAVGGEDKVVGVWPVPAGEKAEFAVSKELKGASGTIIDIETGPDLLIAATSDGKVFSWSVPEGKTVRELAIPGVATIGLSADSKSLASARADGVVQVWDLAAGKPIVELTGDAETNARAAEFDWIVAKEGLEIAFQKQEVARIEAQNKGLDDLLTKANENITNIKKDLVEKQNGLKQATDTKDAAEKALTAVMDQVAKAPNGKPDAALEKSIKEASDKVASATQAESVAQAAFKALEIHLKDAEIEAQNYSGAQSKNKSGIAGANEAAAKAKAAQDKATADSAATKTAAATRKLTPLAVRFSADAKTVCAAYSDGSLRVWAVASGVPIKHLPGSGGAMTAASVVNCDDGAFASSFADGSTSRANTTSRWVLERTLGGESAASPFVDRVNAVRFSPDGKTLAVGGGEPTRSGDISLWDVESGNLIKEWKERHSDAVLSLDFSPDGKQLASGGADKLARVTDIASGKLLNVFEGHTHHVLGVSFRADGRVLATAGGDRAVVVWDMISGERKVKIEGWSKEVTSVQFIGATNQILTSAGDNLVRIVNDGGGQVRAIANLPDFMQSAASSANASVIIGGGEDSVLRIWNGTTGQELAVFGAESPAK